MRNHLITVRGTTVALVLLTAIVARAVPEISSVDAGNVSTTSFCLCWETSETSIPGLDVFSDAGATQSLAGQVRVEFYPLGSDQRSVGTSASIRAEGRSLREEMRAKRLVLVKISGLLPGTDYFARPTAVDESGAPIASGDLQSVTTSQTVEFTGESRQVEIDLAALEIPGTPVAGTILTIATPTARYPLLAVVGDSWHPSRAYADLTQFLNATGDRNLLPSGVLPLTITWKGLLPAPGSFLGPDPEFDGSLLVARITPLVFDVAETNVDYIISFMHVPAVVGLPQNIALDAQGPGATTLLDYDRPALIGTTGSLAAGEGVTSPFTDGLLAAHTIVFNSPGMVDLTVSDPLGSSVSSAPIEVLPLTYDNWRMYYFGNTTDPAGNPDANPEGDALTNRGEFATLGNPLVANPSPMGVRNSPGGITVSLDFNRFQSEYRVRFQTSLDLRQWDDSPVIPSVRESLADRDIIQAFFSTAEFNDNPFGAVRAVFELIPTTTVAITGVSLTGNIFAINFISDPGIADWRVMASVDLVTFPFDRTAQSTITEPSPGVYRAEVDLTGAPETYFLRVER